MYDFIPDNFDLFDQYEAEQERVHRRMKRIADEWEEIEFEWEDEDE